MKYIAIVTSDRRYTDEAVIDVVLSERLPLHPALGWDGDGYLKATLTVEANDLEAAVAESCAQVRRVLRSASSSARILRIAGLSTAAFDTEVEALAGF